MGRPARTCAANGSAAPPLLRFALHPVVSGNADSRICHDSQSILGAAGDSTPCHGFACGPSITATAWRASDIRKRAGEMAAVCKISLAPHASVFAGAASDIQSFQTSVVGRIKHSYGSRVFLFSRMKEAHLQMPKSLHSYPRFLLTENHTNVKSSLVLVMYESPH